MLRRLYPEQPDSFSFTRANREWAKKQVSKFPEGRQASAVIPLLWRAQEQEGWISRPAIEEVARMLDMAYIRVLEVATFYFMFQLQPVGSVAHVQVCGTTSCMICGAEDLISVCRDKIAAEPHALSEDGRFSWEEVECLGACANAPMAQIGKDYYEDLTAERLGELLDAFARGEVPTPGPQNGRFASEPKGGLTSLDGGRQSHSSNASVTLADALGDTVARIGGDETPPAKATGDESGPSTPASEPSDHGETIEPRRPEGLPAARAGAGDNLKEIKGIGPKLEKLLHEIGVYHHDQIASWGPAEVVWVDENIEGAAGRATRDGWVEQARQLIDQGETPYTDKRIGQD